MREIFAALIARVAIDRLERDPCFRRKVRRHTRGEYRRCSPV
jgi:hypothetical protein